MKAANEIIIKPLITEKSLKEANIQKYTFLVDSKANKTEIKNAIKALFNVDAKEVYTANIKTTVNRTTRFGRTKKEISYKKARVLLGKDQKIDLFEEAVE